MPQFSWVPDDDAVALRINVEPDRHDAAKLRVSLWVKNQRGDAVAKGAITTDRDASWEGLPEVLRDVARHWLYGDVRLLQRVLVRAAQEHELHQRRA